MLKRGFYQELVSGKLFWLLYELDGRVHVRDESNGRVRIDAALFRVLYTWQSESA